MERESVREDDVRIVNQKVQQISEEEARTAMKRIQNGKATFFQMT